MSDNYDSCPDCKIILPKWAIKCPRCKKKKSEMKHEDKANPEEKAQETTENPPAIQQVVAEADH